MKNITYLKNRANVKLKVKEPFSFKHSVKKPSHFYTMLEYYDESNNCFYRSMRMRESLVGLKMQPLKKQKREIGIYLQIFSDNSLDKNDIEQIKERVIRSYGLEEDITEFYSSVKDQELKQVIRRMRGMRNSCSENLFEILNIAIVLQNSNVKRSEQMMTNLLNNFGDRVFFDGVMLDVFYSPERMCKISEKKLRELKLGYRAKYILEVAKFFRRKKNFEDEIQKLTFDEAKKELMKIKGIGLYSVSLTLFSFLRSPVFINFDVWNKKILSNFLFGKEVELDKLEKECEDRWGSFKGYAALYVIEDHFIRNPELQRYKSMNNQSELLKNYLTLGDDVNA